MRLPSIFFMLLAFLFSLSSVALTFEPTLDDPAQEAHANALFREIRCMVCTAESIHESKTELAQDMRTLVRTKITEGLSDQAIKDYLVERYGYEILMSPPFVPLTYMLWLGPVLLLLLGITLILLFSRNRRT